jgi:molybdopterin-guanine dinucleotide biosynthesis protein B
LGKPYIYPDDPNIIAIASDHEIDDKNAPTKLDLNQPQQIVEFIERKILKSTPI